MRSAAPTTRQAVERVTWIQRCGAEVVEALAGLCGVPLAGLALD